MITKFVRKIARTVRTSTLHKFAFALFGVILFNTTPSSVILLLVVASELRTVPIVFASALAAEVVNNVEVVLLNWILPFLTVVFVSRGVRLWLVNLVYATVVMSFS